LFPLASPLGAIGRALQTCSGARSISRLLRRAISRLICGALSVRNRGRHHPCGQRFLGLWPGPACDRACHAESAQLGALESPHSICSLFCCLLLTARTDAVGTFAGISRAFRCSVVTTATGVTRRGLVNHQSKQSFALMALWHRSSTPHAIFNL
jgi:hypothetical protein